MSICSFIGPLLLAAMWHSPQTDVAPQSGEIELKVELRQGGKWQPVDVHTVFRNKDELRFTLRTTFPGYLKVVNHSSDGQTSVLFPLVDAARPPQLQANTNYFVPGTKGSFVVAGKPGFDLTEWFLSSTPLDAGSEPTALPSQPSPLLPRCPDEELQAKHSCLDSRAGVAAWSRAIPAPTFSSPSEGGLVSRDLNFGSRDLSAVITVPDTSRKVVVYEFRVAHH